MYELLKGFWLLNLIILSWRLNQMVLSNHSALPFYKSMVLVESAAFIKICLVSIFRNYSKSFLSTNLLAGKIKIIKCSLYTYKNTLDLATVSLNCLSKKIFYVYLAFYLLSRLYHTLFSVSSLCWCLLWFVNMMLCGVSTSSCCNLCPINGSFYSFISTGRKHVKDNGYTSRCFNLKL